MALSILDRTYSRLLSSIHTGPSRHICSVNIALVIVCYATSTSSAILSSKASVAAVLAAVRAPRPTVTEFLRTCY
eukprot:15178-Heterococcus_DN1.PRE.5